MIEVTIDHSYEDDYFMIGDIRVNIKDPEEKKRIEEVVKRSGLIQRLIYPDRQLSQRIAQLLGVDVKLIDIDTNEIDLM